MLPTQAHQSADSMMMMMASHRIAMLLVPAEVFRFCCFSLLLISGDFYFHLLLIKREKQYAYTHSISFHFGSNRIHSEKDAWILYVLKRHLCASEISHWFSFFLLRFNRILPPPHTHTHTRIHFVPRYIYFRRKVITKFAWNFHSPNFRSIKSAIFYINEQANWF